MSKRLIIGLGTGRCGTWSLTKFLGAQPNTNSNHELRFLPWEFDAELGKANVDFLLNKNEEVAVDVGFYWLNYVDWLAKQNIDVRFICLQRDKKQTVDSWMTHTEELVKRGQGNHWTSQGKDKSWTSINCFPKYDLSARKAIEKYWDEYYEKANKLWEVCNFHIVPTEELNTSIGQARILSAAGYDSNDRVLQSFHLNKTVTTMKETLVNHTNLGYKSGKCEICQEKDCAEWCLENKSFGMTTYACSPCRKSGDLGIYTLNDH